jgi:2-methylisocitrate lyase-like PEP mutase family enzyme
MRQDAKARAFKTLHVAGGFIMPNAWDAGSAVILAEQGFAAIATTSAGVAFSLGKPDYGVSQHGVTREEMLARVGDITRAVNVPVNADLEAGYGDGPEIVAETIKLAIEAGAAGGNIEDRMPGEIKLYDEALAVERIAAARRAIDAMGGAFVLTARTDGFLVSASDALKRSIRRANLYRAAGADCLFVPGPVDVGAVVTLVREIEGPLNVVMGLGQAAGNANALIAAGVRRISLGGSIARSALGLVRRAAQELRERGTVTFAAEQIPQSSLNETFVRARSEA